MTDLPLVSAAPDWRLSSKPGVLSCVAAGGSFAELRRPGHPHQRPQGAGDPGLPRAEQHRGGGAGAAGRTAVERLERGEGARDAAASHPRAARNAPRLPVRRAASDAAHRGARPGHDARGRGGPAERRSGRRGAGRASATAAAPGRAAGGIRGSRSRVPCLVARPATGAARPVDAARSRTAIAMRPSHGHVRRRLAAAAQRLDPTHEEACRVFMQCAAEEGDTAAALRAYNDIWTLLEQDYDCEPSITTQELVADIKLGKYNSAAAYGHGRGSAAVAGAGARACARQVTPGIAAAHRRAGGRFRGDRRQPGPDAPRHRVPPRVDCLPRPVPRMVGHRFKRAGQRRDAGPRALSGRSECLPGRRRHPRRAHAARLRGCQVRVERALRAAAGELVRGAAEDRAAHCRHDERAGVHRAADAARRRA